MEDIKSAFVERLTRLTSEFGGVEAMRYQGRRYPWSAVAEVASVVGEALEALGPDDSIAVVLRSRPWCLAAVLSVLGSGRGVQLVSPVQPDEAIVAELRSLGPALVVADSADWARPGFSDAAPTAAVVELHESVGDGFAILRREVAPAAIHAKMGPDEAVGLATSGTTGPAKRHTLSWKDIGFGGVPRDPSETRGALINVLPLFSIGGVSAMVTTMFGGRPIALMDRFDVMEWAKLVRDVAPSRAGAPPAILRMVLDNDVPKEWFASVRSVFSASAPLPPELAAEFEARYGIPVLQGYGATEFVGAVTGWSVDLHERYGDQKKGSVGRALPGVRLRVVDRDTGAELPAGEEGRLEVDPPRRVQGLASGWITTNDLARMDEDGFLWILGRTDDVIIRGGFKVHLPDVEQALIAHPKVADACVVPLTDARVGEVPGAVVVSVDARDVPLSESELIEWVKSRLPPYAAPATVVVVDALPMNAMFKKDRPSVRKILQNARQ